MRLTKVAAGIAAFLLLAGFVPAPGADPLQSLQWGLDAVEAPGAWHVNATGKDVVVAVVDTGVDVHHPEFKGRLARGASWICGDGQQVPCRNPADYDDVHGHGTHVAGIVAAPRDGRGTVGVAPDAKILPIRALNADGSGDPADVAAGIRWAADNGAHVINLSLGPPLPVASLLPLSDAYFAAIDYAIGKGVLVVAAAGNTGLPLCDNKPLLADGALCVGATGPEGTRASYSNFGLGLDVVAPGGSASTACGDPTRILSTYALDAETDCDDGDEAYEALSGTSMAAPHAAGVGALLAQVGVTGREAADLIVATAQDAGPSGEDLFHGAGLVNALNAVAAATGGSVTGPPPSTEQPTGGGGGLLSGLLSGLLG